MICGWRPPPIFRFMGGLREGHGEQPGSSKALGDKLSQRDVGSVQKRHPMNGKNCKMRTGISLVRPAPELGRGRLDHDPL